MVALDIQAKEIIDKISDELKVQPAHDIPRKLSENIQLTYGVNPSHTILSTFFEGTTQLPLGGPVNLLSKTAKKRLFITGVEISMESDVTCNDLVCQVAFNDVFGKAVVTNISKLTTSAQHRHVVREFNPPIESLQDVFAFHPFTAGASHHSFTIHYFETDAQ